MPPPLSWPFLDYFYFYSFFLCVYVCVCTSGSWFFFYHVGSRDHTQAITAVTFTTEPTQRPDLGFLVLFLHFLSAKIAHMCHYAWFTWCWGLTYRTLYMLWEYFTNWGTFPAVCNLAFYFGRVCGKTLISVFLFVHLSACPSVFDLGSHYVALAGLKFFL